MSYKLLGFMIGNTIVGEVVNENEKEITLKNPMEVMTIPTEGRVQISIVPLRFVYNDAVKNEVTFAKSKVLFTDDLENIPNLLNGYKNELQRVEEMKKQAAQTASEGKTESGIITG